MNKKRGRYADRMDNLRVVDPVLTELARGYTNSEHVLSGISPLIMVDKEKARIPVFGKEAFKLYETHRAIRGKSNRMNPEGRTYITIELGEHDFEFPVDYREQTEDSILDLLESGQKITTDVVANGKEKTGADILQDLNTYPSGHKVTLTSTDQWTDGANSDPLSDVRIGKAAIRKAIGRLPNTMLMGYAAFETLEVHPKLMAEIRYTGEQRNRLVTIEIMKNFFGIERIIVGMPMFSTDAGVLTDIWGDNVVLAYVNVGETPSKEDPSFSYTFRKKGQPVVDRYTENGGKVDVVRTTDIYRTYVVGSSAGYLIKDVNADS